jgi:hypothetical protein
MRNRRSLDAALLAVLASLLVAAPASGQQAGHIQGTFTLVEAQSDNVDRAVDQAVARMNIATRQVARTRLRRTNQPYRRIVIAPAGSSISITTDTRSPITTSFVGTPTRWTREDGEVLDVSTVWEGQRLRQTFAAEDGRRINLYTLSPDGNTLTLQVTVTSGRLPQPLTYRLVYQRQS